jgi:DNA processing protein
MGTVVIEAAEKSGALMTANLALDQGREVFAVPGSALSPVSRGTNALIQTGAKMVVSAQDILNELDLDRVAATIRPAPVPARTSRRGPENDIEAAIMCHLSTEPRSVDDLVQLTSLPIMQVNSTLTVLELRELVRQVGVRQYVLADGVTGHTPFKSLHQSVAVSCPDESE